MYNTIQKTIAAWAFNHYIACYYFDNVNVDQLKVAFERGEVELENIPIKKDALQHFNLPMEVVSGVVGRLSLKIPLLSMLTDSWVIKISNLMIVVAPKKQFDSSASDEASSSTATSTEERIKADQSYLDLIQETSDANLAEYLDNSTLEEEGDCSEINTEETKLAEIYTSFYTTVSSMVHDIKKNIRLEIETMSILFEDFDHGLVKFNVDSLLIHRPKSARNLIMENVSLYLSSADTSNISSKDDLIEVNFERANLDIYDEASMNMQLVLVQENNSSSSSLPPSKAKTSETKIEGSFKNLSIELLKCLNQKNGEQNISISSNLSGDKSQEGVKVSRRNILKCDTSKLEFKLNNNNLGDDALKMNEKNLHIKLDLVGMQYIHSQHIYELTTQRLMNLLKFFIQLHTKQSSNQLQLPLKKNSNPRDLVRKHEDAGLNKLLIINIEEGLLYIVDDTVGSSAIPLLEFSLDDCRILQFSGKHQQNGFVFAKIGCNYYNREVSSWDTLLRPWPFNLSWDLKSSSASGFRGGKVQRKEISLNSDEMADFVLSSTFLDLSDIALKRMVDDFCNRKLWPLATSLHPISRPLSQDLNSIFVINNETGYKLHFAPIEQSSELYEIFDSSTKSSPTLGMGGDSIGYSKPFSNNRSFSGSRDSPELCRAYKWIFVDAGETVSFEYDSLPIYRRHINDLSAQSRILLIRVEGWKTLLPISIDKTGLFFREAFSDRVMNEDTYVVISIDLEDSSARKIISIRSPLNLVNLLDATLEVHFAESNQALYIKPDSQLSVPLPYLFNRMHIRPCNVGVTMSRKALLWDAVQQVFETDSKIHICHPITVTDQKHASYCTSQPYRICVSTRREGPKWDEFLADIQPYNPIPVFSMSFIPPLTIVNLLPCKLQYFISEIGGSLNAGAQQRIYQVDTTKSTDIQFKMNGFPESKAINIDPGATGSFHHTLEMFDKRNRSLYLNAEIILVSLGDEPAVQVVISAPFWFINKTRLPLIFKQEGAALEAAGQFCEHEDSVSAPLLFSFYDIEIEPPWLCSMRLGKSKGSSMWSDGFKLEKGSGERRICFMPDEGDTKLNKTLIDINIRRGFGHYSHTIVVTFTARYGFDPLTKTPKKASMPSPQNYKLTSYNHNANLAERIAGQINLFDSHYHKGTSDINLNVPGFKLTLVDNMRESLIEASVKDIVVKCTTKAKEQIIDCSAQDIRIENVLPDCEKCIMLDRASTLDESMHMKPALRLIMDRVLGNSFGTNLFRQVQLSMCELVLNIEEKLVLKLVEFISFRNRREKKNMNNLAQDLDRILHPEEDRLSKYYFDLLRIDLSSLKLSVFTSANLNSSLQKLKSYLGLKFFAFEDAQVILTPYFKMNVSRTFKGVFESVTRYYKQQILEQAPRIVGQQIQNYLRFHLSDLLSTLYDEVYNKLFS